MSTKKERSNRDVDDHKRQGQNASGQGPTRRTHASSNASKVAGKVGDQDKKVIRENHRAH